MQKPEDHSSLGSVSHKSRTASMALATFLMIIGLTLSKGTGFLREIFIGIQFGFKNNQVDAFILGFQIPDLFFQLLVGGSIQAAITPSLARSIERGDHKRGWRSVSIFITLMTVIMLAATTLGMLLSDWIFPLIYSGTAKEIVSLAAQSSKALFPQVFFMMLAALCIGILNAYKKFSSTAFGPTVYNICVVISILVFGKQTNQAVINTAIGITASAGVYFLLQFFMSRRELKNFRLSLDIQDEGFRELLRLAVPTMISASIVQLNTIIITSFTGGFGENSGIIQSLQNAKTIWQLPYGIFAVAVGSVMLPSLSAHFAARDYKSTRVLLGKSLRNALFLTIPSAGLLLALRHDVVPAILKWTESYKSESGETTALILMGYCLAVIFQTVVFIYNQAFYAIGKTKIPLYTGALSMVLISGFCFILKSLDLLKPGSVVGALGLSLAYSLTSIITALILSTVYRNDRQLAPRSLGAFIVRTCICMGVLLLVVYAINVFPVNPQSKIGQLVWLAVRGSAGFGGYLLAARAMQMKELRSFVDRIRRKKNPAA